MQALNQFVAASWIQGPERIQHQCLGMLYPMCWCEHYFNLFVTASWVQILHWETVMWYFSYQNLSLVQAFPTPTLRFYKHKTLKIKSLKMWHCCDRKWWWGVRPQGRTTPEESWEIQCQDPKAPRWQPSVCMVDQCPILLKDERIPYIYIILLDGLQSKTIYRVLREQGFQ